MKDDNITTIRDTATTLTNVASQVELTRGQLEKGKITPLVIYYFNLKEAYAELDAARKAVYKQLDALNKFSVPNKMEKDGIDKIQIAEVARSFYPLTKFSASIIDKDKGYEWLRDRGAEAMITDTVNASALSSYFQDLVLNEGVDPPDDIFKFGSYKTTGVSKYTPK